MSTNYDFKSAQCLLCGNAGLTFVNKLRDDDGHWAACCDACGYVQTTPLPTQEEDEKYYQENEMSRRLISKAEMNDIQLMDKVKPYGISQASTVKSILPKEKTILEIGSGYGWFIEGIRKEGYIAEGIELSEEKCKMAWDHLGIKLKNINIMNDKIDGVVKYDAVCMFHLLEHIANPVWFLKRASAFLKQNGCIIIEVPNFNAYMKQYSKEYNDFQYFRGHLSYFTHETLRKVLNLAGFVNVRIFGKQFYSVENAIHWMRNKEIYKPNIQAELPDGLGFVNDYFKEIMQNKMTSDFLVAVGEII